MVLIDILESIGCLESHLVFSHVLVSSLVEISLVENLLRLDIPLGERLLLSDKAHLHPHKPLQIGTVLVNSSNTDATQASPVELPVASLALPVGAGQGGVKLDHHLLQLLHDWEHVESAGTGHHKLLHETVLENFDHLAPSLCHHCLLHNGGLGGSNHVL